VLHFGSSVERCSRLADATRIFGWTTRMHTSTPGCTVRKEGYLAEDLEVEHDLSLLSTCGPWSQSVSGIFLGGVGLLRIYSGTHRWTILTPVVGRICRQQRTGTICTRRLTASTSCGACLRRAAIAACVAVLRNRSDCLQRRASISSRAKTGCDLGLLAAYNCERYITAQLRSILTHWRQR